MIGLKNISTLPIIGGGKYKKSTDISSNNAKLLKTYHITDYEKLKAFYEHSGKYADFSYQLDESDDLARLISSMEGCLRLPDKKKNTPDVYVDCHSDHMKQLLDVDAIDSNVSCRRLLYGTPFEFGTNKQCYDRYGYKRVKTKLPSDIYTLRQLLTHCSTGGVNLLTKDYGLSKKQSYRITNALKLYAEQIGRQLECNFDVIGTEKEKKLFYLDKDEKYELLEEQYKYISEYLAYHYPYVWCTSSSSKERAAILYSGRSDTQEAIHDKEVILDTLSDYVSIKEAENISKKTLGRFIRKRCNYLR